MYKKTKFKATSEKPVFSIVICTLGYNMADLKRCLGSIINQTYRRFDVFVVNQGKKDLSMLLSQYAFKTYYIKTEKRGLCLGFNIGMSKSLAEYLVFLDDDAFIKNNYLEVAYKTLQATNVACLGGVVLSIKTNKPIARSIKANRSFYLKFDDYNQWMCSATIIKRTVLVGLGGFDEDLGVGSRWPSAEDSDVLIRALLSGEKAYICKDLCVYHPTEVEKVFELTYMDASKRGYNYGSGRAAFLRKTFLSSSLKWWSVKHWLILLLYAMVGALISLFKGNIKYFVKDMSSFWGRFIVYFRWPS
jgi:glycosyltransferase involved in cell wall biosynthesis